MKKEKQRKRPNKKFKTKRKPRYKSKPAARKETRLQIYRRRLKWAEEKREELDAEHTRHYVRWQRMAISDKRWGKLRHTVEKLEVELEDAIVEVLRLQDLIEAVFN